MNPDKNWRETRVLCKDIDDLLGIPVNTLESLFKVIENLIVHKLVEQVMDDDQCDNFIINLPYLGSLVINITENGHLSIDFCVRGPLYNKIKKAYCSKESPLVSQCSELLGEVLAKKFEEGEVIDERLN